MMSNSHFRVKLQLKADSKNQVALHCEHPTKSGGEPGGWMEREALPLQVCPIILLTISHTNVILQTILNDSGECSSSSNGSYHVGMMQRC